MKTARLFLCSYALGSALALAPSLSSAQEPPPAQEPRLTERPAPEAPRGGEAITLVLEGDGLAMDAERLRAAIAGELRSVVTLGAAGPEGGSALLLRREAARRVVLTHRAADGRITERAIELPEDPDRAVETVALLAGNLARDEAAELRAALSKRPGAGEPRPAPEARRPRAAGAPLRLLPERAVAAPESAFACDRDGAARARVGVDFVPFVGSSSFTGTNTVRTFSFNVLGGYAAGASGLEIGGLVNIESAFVCGLQIGGLVNAVAGPARGLQIAGVLNVARRQEGAQASLVNVTAGPVSGAQIGFVDIAGAVDGAQAGLIGVSAGDLRGAQIGMLGIAAGDLDGVQLGLVEIARGDVRGAQIGLVNVAGRGVRGVQVGLVNTAETSDFSLGLVNILRRGRLHADLWGTESGLMMAGVKHGGDYFHNIYGIGVRPGGDRTRWSWALGLGAHLPVSGRFFVDLDGIGYSVHGSESGEPSAIAQVRALFGARLLSRFSVYGGPSYNVQLAAPDNAELSPFASAVFSASDKLVVRGWPGAVLGLQAL